MLIFGQESYIHFAGQDTTIIGKLSILKFSKQVEIQSSIFINNYN